MPIQTSQQSEQQAVNSQLIDMQPIDKQLIAYYGGTFDPIHNGHLNICRALLKELPIKQINLLPNNIPPHRPQPLASSQQRLAMLKLAIQHETHFSIDERELKDNQYSYTIETLIAIRSNITNKVPLAFIIGLDSLETLMKWHRWQELLDYTHLVVCPRTEQHKFDYSSWFEMEATKDKAYADWVEASRTESISELLAHPNGYIYFANTPLYDISATAIRALLAKKNLEVDDQIKLSNYLSENVLQYIEQAELYR